MPDFASQQSADTPEFADRRPGVTSLPLPPAAVEADVTATLRAAGCVFAEDEARLLVASAAGPDDLAAKTARRAAGLPLEHVVGWAEFAGRRITVDPGVFVPRRRTEFLVRQALAHGRAGAVVLDLCCGSGAVGVALAAATGAAELHAADVDPAAVACARRNIAPFRGTAYEGDLFAPLPAHLRGRVDLLAANVPYVPSADVGFLPPEAREHEALTALDGGPDGLDVVRRVAAGAAPWLAPGGALFFETSERQAPQALEIVREGGLQPRIVVDEEMYATVVIGVRTAD
jgi:release factor glutamine methyltransferase